MDRYRNLCDGACAGAGSTTAPLQRRDRKGQEARIPASIAGENWRATKAEAGEIARLWTERTAGSASGGSDVGDFSVRLMHAADGSKSGRRWCRPARTTDLAIGDWTGPRERASPMAKTAPGKAAAHSSEPLRCGPVCFAHRRARGSFVLCFSGTDARVGCKTISRLNVPMRFPRAGAGVLRLTTTTASMISRLVFGRQAAKQYFP